MASFLRRSTAILGILAALGACSARGASDGASSSTDLTGVTSEERDVHFQSYVYVAPSASDDDIKVAIARQVKTALGALRDTQVALDDRGAESNLDPAKWTKTVLPVAGGSQVLKVGYRYDDHAVVTDSLASRNAVDFTMLADDYTQHAAPLIQDCSDDTTTDAGSLWYHFSPDAAACSARIQAEIAAVAKDASALSGAQVGTIAASEASRWFITVTAQLDAPQLPSHDYAPEYDRLYGVGTDKTQLVVYAFFGVDTDETSPDDAFGLEAMKFLRVLLAAQPNLRVTKTDPFAMLEDIYVDGNKVDGVTYQTMLGWLLDQTGYPAAVGTDAQRIKDLRAQAMAKLTERWIYWDLPVTVTDASGNAKNETVEVRFFHGDEASTPDAQQHAEWRYYEAFWYGDVFLYNGHSHFGNGPLDPQHYSAQNFDDRYQLVVVNSCISYNYYHEDFFRMKPGGTKNMDMIVNGSPSYVDESGTAVGRLVAALLDGQGHSYKELLGAMKVDLPWGEAAYDPMRVADGELDNVFDETKTPLAVKVLPPVYP